MLPPSMALLVFIHAGGVHGLAHRLMSGLMASAALMYGMRYWLSWLIENEFIAVSPAVSFSV